MRRSRSGFVLGWSVLLLGLAWMGLMAKDPAWERMQDIHAQIRELTHADFVLNLETLRVRSGVVSHYDDVSAAERQLREKSQDLRVQIESLEIDPSEFTAALNQLQLSIEAKTNFVERLLAQNSILRNSESFLPILLDEYGDDHSQEIAHNVQGLLLKNMVLNDPRAADNLKRELESLADASKLSAFGDIKTRIALHGLKTLEIRQGLQPLLRQFMSIPVHEAIAEVHGLLLKEQTAHEHRRERSRTILYLAALGFFLLSLLMLLRFLRLNRKIRKFVPYEMLDLLGKKTLLDIEYGTSIQREMTVMFVDLRDFTRSCETRKPSDNFAFVNEYLAAITPAIQKHRGFVSQFSGDGFMALFPESADDALHAARNLIRALSLLNESRHARGEESLSFGIGINTSELMLGAIGHRKRMECTVLGNGVNIAARVEGLTRIYGCEVLLTESTVRTLTQPGSLQLRVIDHVRPKGLQEPVHLYELLDADVSPVQAQKVASNAAFQNARRLYTERQFQEAAEIFARLAAFDSVSALYHARCLEHSANAPGPEWRAIADFAVK